MRSGRGRAAALRPLPQSGMLAIIVALAVVIADQVGKAIVSANMELYSEAGFIPGVISFYHTRNTGAAFSMLSDKQWVFMVLSAVMIAAISWFLVKHGKRHALLTVALALILGGGIGNMIDRIRLGYVTDFLRFDFVDFAVFNIADSCITVGAVLLGVYILFFEPKVEKRLAAQKAEAASQTEAKTSAAEEAPPAEDTPAPEAAPAPAEAEEQPKND